MNSDLIETSPPLEFRPFARLPTELRHKIWKLAMPAPSLFEIDIEVNGRLQEKFAWGFYPFAILKVDQEAREIARSGLWLIPNTILNGCVYLCTTDGNPPIKFQLRSEVRLIAS